jgi:flagellar FliJ protein
MNDLQPLMALLAQTEAERDNARLRCLEAQATAEAALAQSEQLRTYRGDYERRWGAEFSRDGKVELLRCYQTFVERLTQAVDQQGLAAERAALQHAQRLAELAQHEIRVSSVRKLIERRAAQQQMEDMRREQRQTDELASRAAWNRQDAAARAAH